MANLIIKPTSGGSLILQDEGGDAALTVGTTGNTTFAGSTDVSAGVTLPAGHIVQVVQTALLVHSSYSASSSFQDVTNLNATITPKKTGNKILVTLSVDVGSTTSDTFIYFNLVNGSTTVTAARGNLRGSETQCWMAAPMMGSWTVANYTLNACASFLDSPTIPSTPVAITYKIQVRTTDGVAHIGGTSNTSDGNRSSTPSVLTLMEVVA